MATHPSILAWRIPMNRGAWQATVHGVAMSDTTERLILSLYFSPGEAKSGVPRGALARACLPLWCVVSPAVFPQNKQPQFPKVTAESLSSPYPRLDWLHFLWAFSSFTPSKLICFPLFCLLSSFSRSSLESSILEIKNAGSPISSHLEGDKGNDSL